SLPDKSQPAAQLAQKVTDGIKNTQQLLRKIIEGFMPVDVDPEGLRAALEDLVARLNETHSVTISLTCRGATHLKDNATATSLFRIAQESVNNALKHSQGDRIEITLSAIPNSVILEIQDNGVGIDATPREAEGMGLGIMQYRASVIGATLGVAARPEGGTVVRCEFRTASG
ncbi:MAG: hypothetical protein KDB05_31600, partial [Planctomycetales bacterium]|nr:hypothetical protein [Planctomycetales bacterium]